MQIDCAFFVPLKYKYNIICNFIITSIVFEIWILKYKLKYTLVQFL